ncbi:AMP-binding protein [Peribacillus sp. NPDC097295]|uniref:AMP-binding protein n=1 Tax=Peribacillus sp. NPDC097295 TaxID=3364402 RepID=UPI0037F771E4
MNGITSPYAEHANHFPTKWAIRTADQKINYLEWYELVRKTANWFDCLGQGNKKVGIYMPNGISFLQIFVGASTAGWTAVPMDLKWKEVELQKRLALSEPSVLITTKDFYPKINVLYPNALIWEDCLEEINQGPISLSVKELGNAPFYMGFTSGSTGEPKAFVRSHNSWIESFRCTRAELDLNENDHVIIPGSLIHSHFLYGAISLLFLGGTVYILEKFMPSQTLSWIHRYPISVIYMVPTMVEAMLKETATIREFMKIISSGAKWEKDSKRRLQEMFLNLSVYELYGSSELSFVSVLNDEQNKQRPESVGKPCFNVDIQIRKANQELARPFEIGKIYVKSRMAFIGYLNANHQEIESIVDVNGWMTVHDLGYLDEEGYLYISGRENNLILYGGINIFPEEIEAVLSTHPYVELVAVVGISDPYWGHVTTAVIKGDATKMELKRFCKTKLASYKVPRKWFFIEDMPLTASGKIARAQIKQMIEKKVISL